MKITQLMIYTCLLIMPFLQVVAGDKLAVKIKDKNDGGGNDSTSCIPFDVEIKEIAYDAYLESESASNLEVNIGDELKLIVKVVAQSNQAIVFEWESDTKIFNGLDSYGEFVMGAFELSFAPVSGEQYILNSSLENTDTTTPFDSQDSLLICNECEGGDITLTQNEDLNPFLLSDRYVRASDSITAHGLTMGSEIAYDGVRFQAGSSVVLKPGFVVLPNTTFHAYIADCEPTTGARLAGDPDEIPITYEIPAISELSAYPNPFRDRVRIHYTLEDPGPVTLVINTIDGKVIDEITQDEWQEAGGHEVVWTPKTDQKGIFIALLITAKSTEVFRLIRE